MTTVTYLSRNFPQHLANSLDTIGKQTVKPTKVVVIDCSDDMDSIKIVVQQFYDKYAIPYEFQWRPVAELSRSHGRHLGRQYVDTPIMISTECDILWPPTIIEESIKCFGDLNQKIYVQPYIVAYNENGTLSTVYKDHRSGFYQMFRVCDFDAIGGYNPFLRGWGFEDADFRNRLLTYGCKKTIVPLIVKHLWHPSSASSDTNTKNQQMAKSTYWDGTQWKRRS